MGRYAVDRELPGITMEQFGAAQKDLRAKTTL